jgi:hypothetical protein
MTDNGGAAAATMGTHNARAGNLPISPFPPLPPPTCCLSRSKKRGKVIGGRGATTMATIVEATRLRHLLRSRCGGHRPCLLAGRRDGEPVPATSGNESRTPPHPCSHREPAVAARREVSHRRWVVPSWEAPEKQRQAKATGRRSSDVLAARESGRGGGRATTYLRPDPPEGRNQRHPPPPCCWERSGGDGLDPKK